LPAFRVLAPVFAGISRLAPQVLGEGATSYQRLAIFQPMSHAILPWVTVPVGWLSVGIWYNCINQFMVQRVLAARDAWHARMGIVFAGFMKIVLPVLIVVPGLIYFARDPSLDQHGADRGYPALLMSLVPMGLRGLLLAALFGAIQSTVDSVLNSTSTIITLDIYKRWFRQDLSERRSVAMGRLAGTAVLAVSIVIAPFIERLGQGVFVYIQNLYAYFAPPFSAIFVVGILWRRATGTAAVVTIPAGMVFSLFLRYVVFGVWLPGVSAFTLRSVFAWAFCVLVMVFVSLHTPPPRPESVTDALTVNWSRLNIFGALGRPWYRNLAFWWAVFAVGIVACYLAFSGLFFR
ncbi:MAG: Na+/glucose cotransporter, partial [Armatimonadota bacterium]